VRYHLSASGCAYEPLNCGNTRCDRSRTHSRGALRKLRENNNQVSTTVDDGHDRTARGAPARAQRNGAVSAPDTFYPESR